MIESLRRKSMDLSTKAAILLVLCATGEALPLSLDSESAEARDTSCRVYDPLNVTKAFIGLQRTRGGSRFTEGSQVAFHCEPVGLTNGDPVQMTCQNSTWVRKDRKDTVYMPLCSPTSAGDVVVNIRGTFVVGSAGVVFASPRKFLNLTCVIQGAKKPSQTKWKLKSFEATNPRAQTVRIIKGPKVAVSLDDTDIVECECTVSGRKKRITIQAGDAHFCTEPILSPGLKVLKRSGNIVEFTCSEGMKPHGDVMTIECLKSGQWNRNPPSCRFDLKITTPTTESEAATPMRTCPVHAFHEQVSSGVVIQTRQENVAEGSVLEAGCDSPEFVLVGDTGLVTCQKDGAWKFASNLHCVPGCHNFAVVDHSLVIAGVKSTYRTGDSLTFSCPDGKHLEPRHERIMCMGDTWEPNTYPKCVFNEADVKKPRYRL